jgi:hypothetical protein
MAALRTEVRGQLNTLLKTVSGLSASNVYFNDAPPKASQPYCVFLFVAQPVTRDTGKEYNDFFIQISLVGKTLATLETLEAAVKVALEGGTVTLTDHNAVQLRQLSGGANRREVGNYWQIILEYKLTLDEK